MTDSQDQYVLDIASALSEEYRHRAENPERRSYGIHVSDVSLEPGWNCDRTMFFDLTGEDRLSPTSWPDMQRRFSVGHGCHESIYRDLKQALERRYPDYEIDIEFEKPVSSEDGLITGSVDIYITIQREEGGPFRIVGDIKTTSKNEHEKRVRRGGRIQPDDKHIRQVQLYAEMGEADVCLVVYAVLGWPWDFAQSVIGLNPRIFRRVLERKNRVVADLDEGRITPPLAGKWCVSCKYRDACADLGEIPHTSS